MPHVDDGTLHALLDGALRAHEPDRADRVEAHLDACADCRARLEEASTLRDRAADVLADLDAEAVPDPEAAPDFQDVLARAAGRDGTAAEPGREPGSVAVGGTEPDRSRPDRSGPDRNRELRRRLAWTRGLAWAATIAVALGTGYVIRDLAGPTGVVPRTVSTEPADRAMEQSAGADAEAAGTGAQAAGRPEAFAGAEVEVTQEAAPAPAEARPATGERAGRAGAGAAKTTGEEGVEAAPEREPADDAAPPAAMGREAADVMNLATDVAWRAVSVEEAEASAGPLLVLPGATIATAELAEQSRVRTQQRLPGGVEVVVTQEIVPTAAAGELVDASARAVRQDQAGAEPARLRAVQAMPPAEAVPELVGLDLDSAAATVESPVTVTVLRDGRSLTLTAALPEDVLRALAATAAPRTP